MAAGVLQRSGDPPESGSNRQSTSEGGTLISYFQNFLQVNPIPLVILLGSHSRRTFGVFIGIRLLKSSHALEVEKVAEVHSAIAGCSCCKLG